VIYTPAGKGAQAVETDIRITTDGVVFLMHDNTVDRTTNGTGNNLQMTWAQLDALVVDEKSSYGEDKLSEVPMWEEVLEEFKDSDTVFYCHINAKTDACVEAFSKLVDEYEFRDNVLFFISYEDRTKYNSENALISDGITVTSGDYPELHTEAESDLEAVENFLRGLVPYNYQPIFYDYESYPTESFYYQMAARGFINSHSITNGQSTLDKTLLTSMGAVGLLTDEPNNTDDYHYYVEVGDMTMQAGERIDLTKTVRKIVGTEYVNCGLTQISGPELTASGSSYTLKAAGEVTVVFHADMTAHGGSAYRGYSQPVTISFEGTAAEEPLDFEGKTVSVLGDSISTFEGVSNNTSYNTTLAGGNVYYHGTDRGGVQPALDAAEKTLEDAVAALVDRADYTALQAAIDSTAELKKGKYTKKSWDALEEALAAAQAVIDDVNAVQEDANEAEAAVLAAVEGLRKAKDDEEEVTYYNVKIEEIEGVEISVDDNYAAPGQTITVTIEADEDMDVIISDSKGEIETTVDGDKYTFVMPADTVIVTVKAKSDDKADVRFADVAESDWFHDYVYGSVDKGLFSGTSASTFSPYVTTSRAMIVTVLYSVEGKPAVTAENGFADVGENLWYTAPVIWAAENGIVAGYGNGKFGANDPITREQLAVILMAYSRYKGNASVGASDALADYKDADAVSAWAVDAMKWACTEGLLSGKGDGILDPAGKATRAEAATMMLNFSGK